MNASPATDRGRLALIYTRTATESRQGDDAPRDSQQTLCAHLAAATGRTVRGTFGDVGSAPPAQRPAFAALLASARDLRAAGHDVVAIVAGPDRLSRNSGDARRCLDDLRRAGVPVLAVSVSGELNEFWLTLSGL